MSQYKLASGRHRSAEDGRCAMEWVAYLAGESHSDRPVCVSPTLRSFCIELNDSLPDDQRQRLRSYLARTIGTRGDGLDVSRRWLCADWLIRTYTSAWLDLVPSLRINAAALRDLPAVSAENVQRAKVALDMARANAAAAKDGAWDARFTAASATSKAATVAMSIPLIVNWSPRFDTWMTNRPALAPTASMLQDSVLVSGGLLDRMLPLEVVHLPVVSDWREVCPL